MLAVGVRVGSRDRDGGVVSDTLGGYANPGQGGRINRAGPVNLMRVIFPLLAKEVKHETFG